MLREQEKGNLDISLFFLSVSMSVFFGLLKLLEKYFYWLNL